MTRFILLTFALMFWGFYELSGGSDFRAGWTEAQTRAAGSPEVSRAANAGSLTDIAVGAAQAATLDPEAEFDASQGEAAPNVIALDVPTVKATPGTPETPAPILVAAAAIGTGADAPSEAPRPRLRSTADMPTDDMPNVTSIGPVTDMRTVDGSTVNMRSGPGTNFPVLAKLSRGDAVEVLRSEGKWLKLRVAETGRVGWMADFLVTAAR
jgi:hypothetical protein